MKLLYTICLILLLTYNNAICQDNVTKIQMTEDTRAQLKMDDNQLKEFKELVLQKVNLLSLYIKTVADKAKPRDLRSRTINQAVQLFENKNENYVEVSKAGVDSLKKYPIQLYLRKLYTIPAASVEITFYEVARVSDLVLGENGKYNGTAYIYQLFVSKNSEGELLYTDKTIKKIGVSIGKIEQTVGDETIEMWDVKLGNIKVVETK